MLEYQLTQAPFRFGVDEGTDPKQVPFGTLLTAKNVVWKKSGRLEKRQGIVTLGTVSGAKRLIVRGSELALTDGSSVYSYAGSSWVDRGRLPNVGLTWETSHDSSRGVKSSDVAYLANGNVVHAWVSGDPTNLTTGGDIYIQVTERSTGAMVAAPTLIAGPGVSGTRVRIVVSGSSYAVIWTSAGTIYSYVAGTTTALKTDAANSAPNALLEASFDACVIGSLFVIAYALDAGGIRLVSYTFATTPVQQVTDVVTSETSVGIHAISIDGASGETLYIGYVDVAGALIRRAMANPSTLAQTVAPATIDTFTSITAPSIGVHRTSSTTAVFAWSLYDVSTEEVGFLRSVHMTSGGTSYTASYTAFTRLLSRPWTMNGRQYALVGNFFNTADLIVGEDIIGADTYVADITVSAVSAAATHRLVGKVDLLTGGAWFPGHVTNVATVGATEWILSSPLLSEAASNSTGWRQGFRTVTVTQGESLPADMWRSVRIGPETVAAAGVLTAYDGDSALPYGFAHPAYIDRGNTAASSSGGNLATGAYLYNVIPERRSAVGVLHRGPSAVTQSVSVTGPTGSVALKIVPVHLSVSTQYELLAIYRSTVDGEIPQRLTVEPSYVVLVNEYAAAPLGITDTTKDDEVGDLLDLSSRPTLYTEGGELDDYQPPALLTLTTYRNRIFGIDGSGRAIRFSKSHASNPGVAPGFNPALRITIDDDLTALSTLDERLVIFSETAIYYLAGDGPAPNGDGPFDAPNRLQSDVGCTNARGVVAGPDGVFFVSGNEIHMLDRKLNVQWVGKRVQDLLDAFPTVTSAVLVADKNHVRFTANSDTGGIVLVYDYVEGQWSHFVYLESTETGDGALIADACMHGGDYTFITTSGAVYKESDATWLDDGEFVAPLLETAWVHSTGPLAYQSVRNFRIDGVSVTAHGLEISAGFDGNLTYQQGPTAWAEGVAGVTSVGDSITANLSIGTRRKCRSIRFKVTETAPAVLGTGQGAKWSTMGIEVGMKSGFGKLAERQKK